MANGVKQLGVVGGIAAVVAFVLAQQGVRHLFAKFEPNVRDRAYLDQVATEANKTLPSSIDKETEVVSTTPSRLSPEFPAILDKVQPLQTRSHER